MLLVFYDITRRDKSLGRNDVNLIYDFRLKPLSALLADDESSTIIQRRAIKVLR